MDLTAQTSDHFCITSLCKSGWAHSRSAKETLGRRREEPHDWNDSTASFFSAAFASLVILLANASQLLKCGRVTDCFSLRVLCWTEISLWFSEQLVSVHTQHSAPCFPPCTVGEKHVYFWALMRRNRVSLRGQAGFAGQQQRSLTVLSLTYQPPLQRSVSYAELS